MEKPKTPNKRKRKRRAPEARHDISIIHWNTDKRSGTRHSMGALILLLCERQADIVCLQEIEGTPIDTWGLTAWGYNIYIHNKVAILVAIETAERVHEPSSNFMAKQAV